MANIHYGPSLRAVHPPIFFNNKPVQQVSSQKHLGIILGTSLTFDGHI